MKSAQLKDMPEVTAELLHGFSPYLASISFDFETSTLAFRLVDDPDRAVRIRSLTFHRVRELQITSLELDDEFMDSVIGIHNQADSYFFRMERFEISFWCDSLVSNEQVT